MEYTFRKLTRTVKKWTAVLAVVTTAGTATISAGRADEANAKSLLKAMSDYLAAQKAISFDHDFEPRARKHTAAKIRVGEFGHS